MISDERAQTIAVVGAVSRLLRQRLPSTTVDGTARVEWPIPVAALDGLADAIAGRLPDGDPVGLRLDFDVVVGALQELVVCAADLSLDDQRAARHRVLIDAIVEAADLLEELGRPARREDWA